MLQSVSGGGSSSVVAKKEPRRLPAFPWVFYVAIAIPNMLDAWLTVRGMSAGIPEANPMMRLAMEQGGAHGFWLVKAIGVGLLVGLAEACRVCFHRVPTTMLVAVSAMFIMAVLNNLTWFLN